jgi:hypothetical protein
MISNLYKYDVNSKKWSSPFDISLDSDNTLVVVFATSDYELLDESLNELISFFVKSTIIGASTAGEIFQDELYNGSIVAVVMKFNSTKIKLVTQKINSMHDSYNSGVKLSNELLDEKLKAIFVLSDGLAINGSQLTNGISSILSNKVVVTGGLAGDGSKFEKTWIIANGEICSNFITAVGFYGDNFHIGYGSEGGWDKLGIQRVVTKSKHNILYELDGQPALDLYKQYLGDKGDELPASGLLFPLEIKTTSDTKETKVRTILAVDEQQNSITFAGDIPEGSYVTLMKANFDRIIDGATKAAHLVNLEGYNNEDIVSIAISCVGRHLILKQRTEEELEATLDVLPPKTKQIGFYSYGEISPLSSGQCDLHNQTMTLTLIWESDALSS